MSFNWLESKSHAKEDIIKNSHTHALVNPSSYLIEVYNPIILSSSYIFLWTRIEIVGHGTKIVKP
jgi:hypothetical protein